MNTSPTPPQRPVEKVALLLELMCDPTTAWTTEEVWCRIESWVEDRIVPVLLTHLQSDDPSFVRLVLNVFEVEAEIKGEQTLTEHIDTFLTMLQHEDLLVRQAAVDLFGVLSVADGKVISELRQIISTDDPYLATQAAVTILKLKHDEADRLLPFLIEMLHQDKPMIKLVVLDCVDSLGKRAEKLLPHIFTQLEKGFVDSDAALAILKITGDDAHAWRVVGKWRQEEEEDEPKIIQQAADELEEEIKRIMSNRSHSLGIGPPIFPRTNHNSSNSP